MTGPVDSKSRFTDRVAEYLRYRPSYPTDIVDIVAEITGLPPGSVVADLGSGTGLSSRPFLERGYTVVGVEPNAEMRAAGDALFQGDAAFRSVDGSAEATGLSDASVDLVVAGQAFHWFDWPAARTECLRILRRPPWAALMWNIRRTADPGFDAGYEALLRRFGTDYVKVRGSWAAPEALRGFFGKPPEERSRPNDQYLDLDELRGRLLSASYAPKPGHQSHEPMMRELRRLFEEHAEDGSIRFGQDARVFVGRLD